jgi:hypothetical protein
VKDRPLPGMPAGNEGETENKFPAARTGPLRNGNPRGNPHAAPRCGARTCAGGRCRQPALANGPAHTTHGFWSNDTRAFSHSLRSLLHEARLACRTVKLQSVPADAANMARKNI